MEYNINYANIKKIDSADGPGIRVSLFVSGCCFRCNGCHNSDAWDYNYGKPFTETTMNELYESIDKDFIEGFSILGGEPLDPKNAEAVKKIIKNVKEKFPNKTIWLWTAYTFNEIILKNILDVETLKCLDVIVDGPFELDKRSLSIKYRGSTNQRVIDVKKTLPKITVSEQQMSIRDEDIIKYCD